MKIDKQLQTVALEHIDGSDTTFQISDAVAAPELVESIRESGLLAPPILQRIENHFRIVSGFRRVAALRLLDFTATNCYIVHDSIKSLDLLYLVILENRAIRPFHPIQVSLIIQKLLGFGVTEQEILLNDLPALGFGRNPRVYQLYKDLVTLEPPWRQAIIADQVALDLAAGMVVFTTTDQLELLAIFQRLKLGKNQQREFLALLKDLTRICKASLSTVLSDASLQTILNDEKLTPSQKAERFKAALWKRRYPNYSQVQERFTELLRCAKLPPGQQILPAPYFDHDTFQVTFSFREESEFIAHLERLRTAQQNGLISAMLELVQ